MNLARFVLLLAPMLLVAQQPAAVSSQTQQPQPPNSQPAPPARPEDLCSAEGRVVNAISGEPVKKAQINVNILGGRSNAAGFGAVTDASGRFVIETLDPGRYNLSAERNGFVQQQYGARGPDRPGSPLLLNPGQHARDLVFRLLPQGVISGHILDEDGEPVQYAQIRVMRYGFVRGQRQMFSPGYGSTDDLGEYRVFGLAPGKYYLSATYRSRNTMMDVQDRNPRGAADEGYAPTYFPGTNDPAGASVIDVSPGAVLTGVDVTLHKTRTLRVRGRVINALGEALPPFVQIRFVPRNAALAGLNSASMARAQNRGGTFEVRDLTPGAYFLIARWQQEGKFRVVKQPVDLGNSNVDDLSVLLSAPLEVKGQVHVDGTGDVNLANVSVGLDPQGPMPMGRAYARLKDDGSFSLDNVNADTYSVTVRGLPPTFYVKSIRMGDVDGLDTALDLTRGAAGVLDIVISPMGGQVEGTVADPKGQMSSGATVVLVPNAPRREQSALFKTASTDTSGHFNIQGIAPGDYQLFAWEDVESGAYQDPEFLKPFESVGEGVTVREGGRESRQLKLIPAESIPKSSGN
jgi:protocatechuate 3,4-dioxygenase beta subunit